MDWSLAHEYFGDYVDVITNLRNKEPLRNVTLVESSSYNYVTTWEIERYDFLKYRKLFGEYWSLSIYISIFYVATIFLGQRWMKNRVPYQLRAFTLLWNLGMGCFFFTGFYRALPEVISVFMGPDGVYRSLCIFEEHTSIAAFWGLMNALSRVLELIGTALIVLKKKPLIFLHWYHHVTVLIYCWYFYEAYEISLRVFGILNSFVHSVVYFYFALKGLGIKVPRKLAMMLTLLQLSEMFIGIFVNIYNLRAKNAGVLCHRNYESIYCAFFMYLTYFILFAKLFKNAYMKKNSRKEQKIE